jgi:hypothetical protein
MGKIDDQELAVKKQKYLKLILLLLLILVTISQLSGKTRRDAAYVCGIDGTCLLDRPLIERYDMLMGYTECGSTLDSVKKYNPNSLVLLYTSGTDNYTQPGVTAGNYYGAVEHFWLSNRCIELGYSPEILYLHFYDDSEVSGISVPGTYTTNLTNGDSLSRAFDYPNYYEGNGHGRILVNFAHPVTRQLSIEYACMVFDSLECSMWRHLGDRTEHFDGYYLDNWMYNWGRRGYGAMGDLTSGGRIVETPSANLIYGSDEFADWYWEQMKLFATALRDTLAMGASWTPDGKRKYLAYNTGQSWIDDYADPDIGGADFLNMEFLFNPIKNVNESVVYSLTKTFTHDSLCAANGVTIVYCSREYIADENAEGLITYSQSIYDNLCWYYAARSDSTYVYMRPGFGNAYGAYLNPGWDSLTWCGAMDYELGSYGPRYYDFDSGTDPKGYHYNVYARQYQNGLVLIRPRGAWGQDFDDATKVTLSLPGGYRYLAPNGTLGGVINSIQLRNGEGAILIPGDMGDCTSPPTVPSLYTPGSGQEVGVRPTLCVYNSDGGDCYAALSYDFQISTTSNMSNIVAERAGVGEGSSTTCYTPSVDLPGGQTYYWRARAFNGSVYSSWSSVRSFMVTGGSSNQPPTSPTLSSPGNGATVSTLTPTLIINNSYDANGDNLTYHFQVSLTSNFSGAVAEAYNVPEGSGSTTSWIVNNALSNSTNYWWRVRAYDGDEYSSFSQVSSFSTNVAGDNVSPTAPTPSSPGNGATVGTLAPTLIINNSYDANGDNLTYHFQVSSTSNFSGAVAEAYNVTEGSGSTTSWVVSNTLNNFTNYWWRVRAYDGDKYSSFSQASNFYTSVTVDNDPPSKPLANQPPSGSTLDTSTPTLVVNNSSDLDGDDLTYFFEVWDEYINNVVSSSPAVPEGSGSTTSWTVDPPLPRGSGYYWRCRSYDGIDYASWMSWSAFYLSGTGDNNPPFAPVHYLPKEGDTLIGASHVLIVFNASDPDNDDLTYDFRISANSQMTQVVEQKAGVAEGSFLTTSYITRNDLNDGNSYYWQSRAYDGQDWSSWIEPKSFVHYDIAVYAEDIPTPISPQEGEMVMTLHPTFKLQTDETDVGVNFYFEAADNQQFNQPLVSGPVVGERPLTVWSPEQSLRTNSTYYWRARAESSGWSDLISFFVGGDIHITPNPFKPREHGENVVFKNIPDGAKIKIATVTGDIIREFDIISGPDVSWDVTNDEGQSLASGVYLYYVITEDGTASGKLAVIR